MKRAGLILALALVALAGFITVGVSLAAGPVLGARPAVPPIFGPNVRANSDAGTNGQHEPSLAVSRVHTNTVVVAAKDYRNGNQKEVWIDVSTDGGVTWPANRQLQMPGINPTQYPLMTDAVVMARDDGRIYVACLGYSNQNAVFITWTDDDGVTWHNPSVQISPADPNLDDKDWFAIDNTPTSPYYHRMYMMYAPLGAAYVAEQHSTDGGLTWTPRQQIGAANTEYTYPVVGTDGTVYNFMMLNWGAGQIGTIQMTKSTNGGATWSAASTVTTADQPNSPIRAGDQFRFFAILSAAVDPNNGALYVAWTDNRNFASNGTDVVYVKSTDGGASWSPVTRLSHDPTGVVRDHITPMITVGADSKVHAFWLDRRLDAANRLFDSWYSSSTDGGATWDPDTRVSTVSQDLNVGLPPGSGGAAGDYWGLDVALDTVYVAWNDTRTGNQDILVSKGLMPGGGPTPTPTGGVVTASPTRTGTPATVTATPPGLTATPTRTGSPVVATPTATPPSCGQIFTDVDGANVFYPFVQWMACWGYISGYICGGPGEPCDPNNRPYFRSGVSVTRGQLMKMVVNAAGWSIVNPPDANRTFEDVTSGNAFYVYVETGAGHGIISGYTCGGPSEPCVPPGNRPYFRWNANITRGQIAKVVTLARGYPIPTPPTNTFADVPSSDPFYGFVEAVAAHGIVSGYTCGGPGEPCDPNNRPYYRPGADATRGQVSKFVTLAYGGP